MAIRSSWNLLTDGDLTGAFGALFVPQEEVDRSAVLAERDLALNRRLVEVGRISQDEELRRMQNIAANRADTGAIFHLDGTNPLDGFKEGWAEGANRIQTGIRSTVGGVLNWGFGSIPWQVWVLVLLWGAWQLGFLELIKRRIAKA